MIPDKPDPNKPTSPSVFLSEMELSLLIRWYKLIKVQEEIHGTVLNNMDDKLHDKLVKVLWEL